MRTEGTPLKEAVSSGQLWLVAQTGHNQAGEGCSQIGKGHECQ